MSDVPKQPPKAPPSKESGSSHKSGKIKCKKKTESSTKCPVRTPAQKNFWNSIRPAKVRSSFHAYLARKDQEFKARVVNNFDDLPINERLTGTSWIQANPEEERFLKRVDNERAKHQQDLINKKSTTLPLAGPAKNLQQPKVSIEDEPIFPGGSMPDWLEDLETPKEASTTEKHSGVLFQIPIDEVLNCEEPNIPFIDKEFKKRKGSGFPSPCPKNKKPKSYFSKEVLESIEPWNPARTSTPIPSAVKVKTDQRKNLQVRSMCFFKEVWVVHTDSVAKSDKINLNNNGEDKDNEKREDDVIRNEIKSPNNDEKMQERVSSDMSRDKPHAANLAICSMQQKQEEEKVMTSSSSLQLLFGPLDAELLEDSSMESEENEAPTTAKASKKRPREKKSETTRKTSAKRKRRKTTTTTTNSTSFDSEEERKKFIEELRGSENIKTVVAKDIKKGFPKADPASNHSGLERDKANLDKEWPKFDKKVSIKSSIFDPVEKKAGIASTSKKPDDTAATIDIDELMANMEQTSKLRPKKESSSWKEKKTKHNIQPTLKDVESDKEHSRVSDDVVQSEELRAGGTEKQEEDISNAKTDSSFASSSDDDLPDLSPEQVERLLRLANKSSLPLPEKRIPEPPTEAEPDVAKEAEPDVANEAAKVPPVSVAEDDSNDDDAIALGLESCDMFSDDEMLDETLNAGQNKSMDKQSQTQKILHPPIQVQVIPRKPIQANKILDKPDNVTSATGQGRSDQKMVTPRNSFRSSDEETCQNSARSIPNSDVKDTGRQLKPSKVAAPEPTTGSSVPRLDASPDRMSGEEELNSTPPSQSPNQSRMISTVLEDETDPVFSDDDDLDDSIHSAVSETKDDDNLGEAEKAEGNAACETLRNANLCFKFLDDGACNNTECRLSHKPDPKNIMTYFEVVKHSRFLDEDCLTVKVKSVRSKCNAYEKIFEVHKTRMTAESKLDLIEKIFIDLNSSLCEKASTNELLFQIVEKFTQFFKKAYPEDQAKISRIENTERESLTRATVSILHLAISCISLDEQNFGLISLLMEPHFFAFTRGLLLSKHANNRSSKVLSRLGHVIQLSQLVEYWSFLPEFEVDSENLNLILDFALNGNNRTAVLIHRVSRILTSQNVDELRQKVDSSTLQAAIGVFCSEHTTPAFANHLKCENVAEMLHQNPVAVLDSVDKNDNILKMSLAGALVSKSWDKLGVWLARIPISDTREYAKFMAALLRVLDDNLNGVDQQQKLSAVEAGKVFENLVLSYLRLMKTSQLVPVQTLFLSQLAANFLARYDEGVKGDRVRAAAILQFSFRLGLEPWNFSPVGKTCSTEEMHAKCVDLFSEFNPDRGFELLTENEFKIRENCRLDQIVKMSTNLIDKILEAQSASQDSQDWIRNAIKVFLEWICPVLLEAGDEPDSKQLTHEFRERESRRIFNRVIAKGLLWYQDGKNLDSLRSLLNFVMIKREEIQLDSSNIRGLVFVLQKHFFVDALDFYRLGQAVGVYSSPMTSMTTFNLRIPAHLTRDELLVGLKEGFQHLANDLDADMIKILLTSTSIANYKYSLEIFRSTTLPKTDLPFLDLKSVSSRSDAVKRVRQALKEICDQNLILKSEKNQIVLVPSAVLAFILSFDKQESGFGSKQAQEF